MSEGLAKKRRIRAGHRGAVTRKLSEVARLVADKDFLASEEGRVKLSQVKLTLTEKLAILKQLDSEILEFLDTDGDISAEIEASDAYSEKVYETLAQIRHCEASITASISRPIGGGGLEGGPASMGSTPSHSKARLPKLVLKPFDGDITKWTTFWDSYESAIHSNSSLTNVDKFTYLQSLLEKTAQEAIKGLALTSDNYEQAVSILEKRFGNRQMIIHSHMDILLSIEGVGSANNLIGLRKLYDKVESNVRSLEALGVTSESYGGFCAS